MKKVLPIEFEDYLLLISRSKNRAALHLYLFYVFELSKYGSIDKDGALVGITPSFQKITSAISLTSDTIRHCNKFLEDIGLIEFGNNNGDKTARLIPIKKLDQDQLDELYDKVQVKNTPIKDARLDRKLACLTDYRYIYTFYQDIDDAKPKLSMLLQDLNLRREDIPDEVMLEAKSVINRVRKQLADEKAAADFKANQDLIIRRQIEELISATKHTAPFKYNQNKFFGHFLIKYEKYFGFSYSLEVGAGQTFQDTKEYRDIVSILNHFDKIEDAVKYVDWMFEVKVGEFKRFTTGIFRHASLINEYRRSLIKAKRKKRVKNSRLLNEDQLRIIRRVGAEFGRDFSHIKKISQIKWLLVGEKKNTIGQVEKKILEEMRKLKIAPNLAM